MKNKLKSLCIALLAALCLGCGSTNPVYVADRPIDPGPAPEPTVTPTATPTPDPVPMAHLRVVHAFFPAENLTLSVDGVVIDDDFDPFEATGFIELEPGQHQIVIDGNLLQQGEESEPLLEETVDLADGSASTFLFSGTQPVVNAVAIAVPEGQLLTDDTTPVPGQLNARLVNSLLFFEPETEIRLDDSSKNTLLGPVEVGSSTPYSALDLTSLQQADFLTVIGLREPFFFSETEGDNSDLIDSLAGIFEASGVNITCIVTEADFGSENLALLILVDDVESGGSIIVSISDDRDR